MTTGPGGALPPGTPFPRELLAGNTLDAARSLLGAWLVREPEDDRDPAGGPPAERRTGRIVEVEAYIGQDDRASHARMGPTTRNLVMFGPPGIAYVYLVYGMYHCLNVVTEPAGRPAAVLIRAVEPLSGLGEMRRGRERAAGITRARVSDQRLAAGPGLVAAAFGLERSHTGLDLCDLSSPVRIEMAPSGGPEVDVLATARIGVAHAGEPWMSYPWRFVVRDSPAVSGRGASPARRG